MNNVMKCDICGHDHDAHFRHVGEAIIDNTRHYLTVCEKCYEHAQSDEEDDSIYYHIFIMHNGNKYIFDKIYLG